MNKAMIVSFIVLALFIVNPTHLSYSIETKGHIEGTTEALNIQSVEHQVGQGYTEILIRANVPFEYTSYDPDPGVLIIEIPEGDVSSLPSSIDLYTYQVKRLNIKTIDGTQGGFYIGRFEIECHPEAQHTISVEGSDLHIRIELKQEASAEGDDEKIKSEEKYLDSAYAQEKKSEILHMDREKEAIVATVDKSSESYPSKEENLLLTRASQVIGMRVDDSHPAYLDITILGDGKLTYRDFKIENPDRVVIDLEQVSMNLANQNYEVNNPYVERVRTGQFQTVPDKIGRVVFDMKQSCPYEVSRVENSLKIRFGLKEETELLASAQERKELTPYQEKTTPTMPPPSSAREQDQESPPAIKATPSEEIQPQEEIIAQKKEESTISSPSYTKADFEKIIDQKSKEDYVIFKEEPKTFAAPSGSEEKSLLDFERKTITHKEVKYTGKKISLNLVDADIKQVFRLFHEISGLNFVLDPAVGGKVTIVLDNVPWDQALDIILKNNGLDKVFENNVIRIAPTQKLSQEAASRKQLKEAKELEIDPITITRTLSYAKAIDIERIIRQSGMVSSRGRVIMDERTNSLIVTDVPTRIPPIDNLITNLDTETPQVMIEARIVETSRQFIQDFGINWGFTGIADPSLGTQTNLQFPHSATINYDLRLPFTPATELSPNELNLSFGNVLNSFTLDMTLEALEVEGKARILSAPKIATQNNEKAEIERGVQIPIVNTTATEINIQFVSASLKLEVTPQITAEETIILDITVENNSPDFVNRVGDIPPINTQRAQTKVLIGDGGTTVIGGIFSQSEGLSELGVPWFRKIPLFGWLFKSRNISNENRELLIFLTPKIMRSST